MDVLYEKWFELFSSIVDRFIPTKNVKIRPRDKPWINRSIRRAIGLRKRDRLLQAYILSLNLLLSGKSATFVEILLLN